MSMSSQPPMPDIDVTCGWCLAGQHELCRPSIYSELTGATYTCDCKYCRDTISTSHNERRNVQ